MPKRLSFVALLASASVITGAVAAERQLAVTIYNNDLALVQDERSIDIPAGRSRQEFKDVSAMIRAETVTLTASDVGIIEQNFDYDLLSPDKLMEKAVGKEVTIVRTNPATGKEMQEVATILAVNGGVVLRIGNRIEVLRDDGLPVRVIFDKVPDNLRARPTLSVTVDSSKSGVRPATLRYLTPGLGWKADYVAVFDEAQGRIDVQGWVTLTNTSGTSYPLADTMLVAGSPNQGDSSQRWYGDREYNSRGNLKKAGTESGSRGRLGDYYLYPLAERTTIADRQTKQVSFLDVRNVPARKTYEFHSGWLSTFDQPQSAKTVLKFSNSSKAGLGDQLPAGIMRFYMKDAKGQPQFIGENGLGHTPMGSELALPTGEAFDVKVKPVVEKREQVSRYVWRTTMSYTLTNARPAPVKVDLIQDDFPWRYWWDNIWADSRIIAETQKSTKLSADSLMWQVDVPANGETKVTATFETRF
jgi:hypothetical protein